MLSDGTGSRAANLGQPLTHSDCLAFAPHGAVLLGIYRPRVQVRRSHPSGAYTLCGQISELANDSDSGTEWFKVETCIGTVWAQGKALRMCSGDGRCTCEPPPGQPPRTTVPASIHSTRSTDQAPIGVNRPAGTAARGCTDV
jgi:hypothetical protein